MINRAIGGTTTPYWTQHLAGVLAAESADAVLMYCGSNDINSGVPEEDIIANVSHCCGAVHGLPSTAAFAYFGIIKAPLFAFIIAMIGCYEGLRVTHSAESVGRQTTRAVVEAVFLVIVLDALFSILFSVLGI